MKTSRAVLALLGMESARDIAVWNFAKDNGYVLVSKDSDFYDLTLLYGTPPKLVWLKSGNNPKSAVTQLLIDNRAKIESVLEQDDISCVEIY